MNSRKLKKQREAAVKLSRPRPVELPSGKWRCQVMVDGKRFDVIEDDPATAHAKALAVKAGLLEQEKSPKDLTVGEAIDRYIESKDAVLSPSTIYGYKRGRTYALQDIMDIRLSDLTQETIQRAVNRMARDKSPKSVRNAHGLLSAVLSVYRPNMVLRTTLPQRQVIEASVPDDNQITMIVQGCIGTKAELPILLAIWLGLRASEIRGLTWDCVKDGKIHICKAIVDTENGPALKSTKTVSGDRWIEAPKYILDLIGRQEKKDEFIVHRDARAMHGYFTRLCRNLGLPHFRFHDLRHASASVCVILNVPNKYAQKRMGHATDNMLKNVYQHTMRSKEDEYAHRINDYFESKLHTNLHTNEI